ncbi:hypothetical protein PR048_021914 [Dryococelus australis]|uniref:Reverse transcriptase domain-containing protein n=1 Tax=Dryococelus australis TaxID=614101 RepID=A0ABQ9GZJ2_9NEOP|nr:hypothetical protein PR048_021914 [Dryococelus australis]
MKTVMLGDKVAVNSRWYGRKKITGQSQERKEREKGDVQQHLQRQQGMQSRLGEFSLQHQAQRSLQNEDYIQCTICEVNRLLNARKDLFEVIRELNYTYSIVLKVSRANKLPFHLVEPLREELSRLEKYGIVKLVVEPPPWVSLLVIVRKPENSIRACLDPYNLNKVTVRECYPLPTFDVLVSQMNGAKVFTTLDGFRGFWQVKLVEKSQKLTTFNSVFGRYLFTRMPYGLCSAPEVFHKWVAVYTNGLVMWGKDHEEHDN